MLVCAATLSANEHVQIAANKNRAANPRLQRLDFCVAVGEFLCWQTCMVVASDRRELVLRTDGSGGRGAQSITATKKTRLFIVRGACVFARFDFPSSSLAGSDTSFNTLFPAAFDW